MATMPDLIDVLAEHRVDTPSTLELFGRRLREAGRVTKGKRGRGAAQMSFLDASRFAIACFATDHPEQAVDAEHVFSGFLLADFRHAPGSKLGVSINRQDHPTLDLAFAAVLKALASGKIDQAALDEAEAEGRQLAFHRLPELVLDRGGGWAQLSLFGASNNWTFRHPALVEMTATIGAGRWQDEGEARQAALDRETFRFRTGKNLRATMKPDLVRALAAVVAGADE